MKRLALLAAVIFAASPALAAEKFVMDQEHSSISFYVNHLGFSDMAGRFDHFNGVFYFDQKDPKNSKVDVTIKPATIDTVSKKLDEQLQGTDWFNTAKYPEVHFVSTAIRVTGPQDAEITGNLTMLGVTKPVVLRAHLNKADYRMVDNQYVAGISADTVVKRSDFGMSKYIPMVGDDIRIHIEVEGLSQERKPGKATVEDNR